jgi:hypothetical protein
MGKAKLGPARAKWKMANTTVPVPDAQTAEGLARARRRAGNTGFVPPRLRAHELFPNRELLRQMVEKQRCIIRWVFARILPAPEEHIVAKKKIDPPVNTLKVAFTVLSLATLLVLSGNFVDHLRIYRELQTWTQQSAHHPVRAGLSF